MNWSTIKVLAWIILGIVGAYAVQVGVVANPDDVLKNARSEVTIAAIEDRLNSEHAATRPHQPPAAETQPAAKQAMTIEVIPVDRAALRERTKPEVRALPWPYWLLALFLDGETLATNQATPSEGQAAITLEAMAVAADPVNVLTGEMTLRVPLVTVTGVGMDLRFVLTYRSGFDYQGPVGRRWEHNWNARYFYGGTNLTRYAENRRDTYLHISSDDYSSPTGQASELSITKYYDGTKNCVERRLRDGRLEVYRELDAGTETGWYFLTQVKHRDSANGITLAYDDWEKLTEITDTRGDVFTLGYDDNERLTAIEDRKSGVVERDWILGYETSTGNLTRIDAEGRYTDFTYTGTSLLESIKAPREVAASGTAYLHNTYDVSNRVSLQRLGGSDSYALTYASNTCTETDREGAKRIFKWTAGDKSVTKIKEEKSSGSYVDTDYEWAGAYVTKVTYPEGNGIQYRYDGSNLITAVIRCNLSGIGATGTPDELRSGGNHLVTEYEYHTGSHWQLIGKITDPLNSDWELARDSDGNVTSYKTPEHPSDPYVIAYDSRSRVQTIDDPEGRRVTMVYGTTGTLSQVIVDPNSGSPLNLTTTLSRDMFENVIRVKDPENRETVYDRNTLGFVTKVTSPSPVSAETDYSYDKNDVVTEVRTDVGISGHAERIVTYTRNMMDLVTSMNETYDSSTRTTSYGYDKDDRLTLVTLPEDDREISHAYDLRGLKTSRTIGHGSSAASTETMVYDNNGRLITKKDGLDQATVFYFDGFDRVTKVKDPEGHYETREFDKNGNQLEVVSKSSSDAELAKTATEYDDNNRATLIKRYTSLSGGGAHTDTTLAYDKSGKLTAKTDACGCGTGNVTYSYDTAARLTKTTDAATNEVKYDLDKSGLVTKITNDEKEVATRTYVVEYVYNADGHLITMKERGAGSATAHTTRYEVDKLGRATKIVDANGTEVVNYFDDLGRLTQVDRGESNNYVTTISAFDLNDNVTSETSVRSGDDATTTYEYDEADRLTTMSDEGGTDVKIVAYDNAHNVITRTDGRGSVSVPLYDKRNLVTQITYTLATNVVGPTKVKYSYDGLGRVTAAVNQRGTNLFDARVERSWTPLSKLASETLWVSATSENGSGNTSRQITYTHDSSGRVVTKTLQDGTLVKHEYDALNRTTLILRKDVGGSWLTIAKWAFQGPHRMTTLEYGNASKETMKYDEYGRATEMIHDRQMNSTTRATMFMFKRGYDAGNRVTRERRDYYDLNGTILGGVRNYGDVYVYDPQNRLCTVVRAVGSVGVSHSLADTAADTTTDFNTKAHYEFDEGGNRKTLRYDVPSGGGSAPVARDVNGFDLENQLTSRRPDTYSGGTWTNGSAATVTYDANGNHISANPTVKVDINNRIYESGSWRYRYDPFGRLVEKDDITTDDLKDSHHYYDGEVCVVEWLIANETEASSGPKWVRIFGPYLVDQLLWGKTDPCGSCGTYYGGFAHLDFLGSQVMITKDTAEGNGGYLIFETYRYGEYGQPSFFDGSGGSLGASQIGLDHLYTGRRWNPELGLYFYRARYYEQTSGRFLSRDRLRVADDYNQYTYVGNAPLDFIDPMGEQGFGPLITVTRMRLRIRNGLTPLPGRHEPIPPHPDPPPVPDPEPPPEPEPPPPPKPPRNQPNCYASIDNLLTVPVNEIAKKQIRELMYSCCLQAQLGGDLVGKHCVDKCIAALIAAGISQIEIGRVLRGFKPK